ncbi:MAG: large subunit ribosomal protein L33 [Glaciecola sp.]|jgi:large subunit ribosomal protein L33
MAKKGNRHVITLESTAGTGTRYMTTKNRVNDRERLELRKYDPRTRQHETFKEKR